MYCNEKHKERVKSRGDGYIYIGSYRCGEVTKDGKCGKGNHSYIRIKCPYCGKEYDVRLEGFIGKYKVKCTNCCHKYEDSFAYYIQQELKEPLNKYWDWEKNIVNPYCVTPQSHKKVYIKCTETDYHDSYLISICNFYNKNRCPYCASKKVHPKDSFGQWLIDIYGNNAVEKYWSPKNTLDPFKITIQSHKKVWLLCQEHEYHNDYGGYEITCANFYNGNRCPYCTTHHGKVHPKDSFGSLYPERVKYWSKNNKKSPFEVSPMSNKKYKFICEKCGKEFERRIDNLNRNDIGVFLQRM